MKKARVIYNPTSGKELLKKNLADILQALEEAGFEASAYATTPEPDSAKNEARSTKWSMGSLRLNTVLKWPLSQPVRRTTMLEH